MFIKGHGILLAPSFNTLAWYGSLPTQIVMINYFRYLLLGILVCTMGSLYAQALRVNLPKYAHQRAVVMLVQGMGKDTLGIATLDSLGKGEIRYTMPKSQGLATLNIVGKGNQVNYEFIVSPSEVPLLSCATEQVSIQNAILSNSPENTNLKEWYTQLLALKRKEVLLSELLTRYAEGKFYENLKTELSIIKGRLDKLESAITHSSLYAAKYLALRLYYEETLTKVWDNQDARANTREYFKEGLNLEDLYGSSLWFAVINACFEAYNKNQPWHNDFGQDMVAKLQKTASIKVYSAFAEACISYTERMSWPKEEDIIVAFLVKDHRVQSTDAKFKKLLDLYNTRIGSKAPDLVVLKGSFHEVGNMSRTVISTNKLSDKYSLLVFHQSGCGHCEHTLTGLNTEYETLNQYGVRIISMSADTSPEEFANTAKGLKWNEKYCDYEGMQGVNFKNYAVMATPTLFLLNSDGIIQSKLASASELMEWLKQKDSTHDKAKE